MDKGFVREDEDDVTDDDVIFRPRDFFRLAMVPTSEMLSVVVAAVSAVVAFDAYEAFSPFSQMSPPLSPSPGEGRHP